MAVARYILIERFLLLAAFGLGIDFRDDWTDGDYEKTNPALLDLVERAARVGCFVDSAYSGKALRGLIEVVKQLPQGDKVLFW